MLIPIGPSLSPDRGVDCFRNERKFNNSRSIFLVAIYIWRVVRSRQWWLDDPLKLQKTCYIFQTVCFRNCLQKYRIKKKNSPPYSSFKILSSQDTWYDCVREKGKGRQECMQKTVGFLWVSLLANRTNENCKIKYPGVKSMILVWKANEHNVREETV